METKKQISAKVIVLTMIIMIVGTVYWMIGKLQIWFASLLERKEQNEKSKLVDRYFFKC